MKKQKWRKGLLITSLLCFPITIWYFSPYLIIQGAMEHIISGSACVFLILMLSSLFFGRFFCGYLCPMGGIMECTMLLNDKPQKRDWRYSIKYIIWVIWLSAVIAAYVLGKGYIQIQFLYMTDHGISISNIYGYIIYYGIILLFFIPSILFGKRFACHYFCWIAPFMILGESIGRKLHFPQLHMSAKSNACIQCNKCSNQCPMSINVSELVKNSKISDVECIQCGVCADVCPKNVLHYAMKNEWSGKNGK